MRCIDTSVGDHALPATRRLALQGVAAAAAALVAGCASRQPAPAPAPSPSAGTRPAQAPAPAPAPAATAPRPPAGATVARNWEEYRRQAARRIVQISPSVTYMSEPPNPLLAIPVLEVELYVDGSIASIRVQRQPSQAPETVQIAIDAVRRAAPFPSVASMPKPWRFSEVFLFDENRRFKPRSLD